MTTERTVVDPVVVTRHNDLFDLYDRWPGAGDPDDDPEFVAQARAIMGLPPFETDATTRAATFSHDEAREVRDMDETDMDDDTELDETEELDEEPTDPEDEPESRVPPDPAAVRRALDEGSLRLRGILETRVAGKDVTPGNDQLHHYWTRDPEGLAKWAKSPHPWTALYHHLVKYVGPERAKRMAAQWHHEVFGIWPGEKKGQNPLGPG